MTTPSLLEDLEPAIDLWQRMQCTCIPDHRLTCADTEHHLPGCYNPTHDATAEFWSVAP